MLKDKEIKEKEPIQKIWHSKLDLETQIPVLDFKYQGKVVRKLPFYEHLGRKNESATILKIGACNFNCPYCFRYSQSEPHQTLPLWKLLKIGMDAINQDMIIRLSGGDPVATSKESVEMVKFFYQQKGEKFSHGRVAVAHNGSSPSFVKKIAPYLEMIALDVKTVPEKYPEITGLPSKKDFGKTLFEKSLQSIKTAEKHGILVEIRTPIFRETTYNELEYIANELEKLDLNKDRTFWTLRIYNSVKTCDWSEVTEDQIYPDLKKIGKHFKKINIGLRRDTLSGEAKIERL